MSLYFSNSRELKESCALMETYRGNPKEIVASLLPKPINVGYARGSMEQKAMEQCLDICGKGIIKIPGIHEIPVIEGYKIEQNGGYRRLVRNFGNEQIMELDALVLVDGLYVVFEATSCCKRWHIDEHIKELCGKVGFMDYILKEEMGVVLIVPYDANLERAIVQFFIEDGGNVVKSNSTRSELSKAARELLFN